MLIPSLQNRLLVKCYLGTDLIQFSPRKTVVAAQRQGREPVLADPLLTLNVYVLRFVAVEAVKEKPIWSGNVLDGRHSGTSWLHRFHRIATRHFGARRSILKAARRQLTSSSRSEEPRLNSSHLGISYAVFCFKK